jgi:hypothetical protein
MHSTNSVNVVLFYRNIITGELQPSKANVPAYFTFICPLLLANVCFLTGEKSTELFERKFPRPFCW